MTFPFDFGFFPGTRGEDGDPLDVLVLMDAPAYPGCALKVRLLGVIEAEQSEKGSRSIRNDRLIAVAEGTTERGDLRSLKDVDPALVDQIESFFVNYNRLQGKTFKVHGCRGPRVAARRLKQAKANHRPEAGHRR
jgi:inorganic pyrophosphatase